jgi:hypothetical protein
MDWKSEGHWGCPTCPYRYSLKAYLDNATILYDEKALSQYIEAKLLTKHNFKGQKQVVGSYSLDVVTVVQYAPSRWVSQERKPQFDALAGVYCVFCGYPKQCRHHPIPVSWMGRRSYQNDTTVPCCNTCNLALSDKIFDSLEDSSKYLLRYYRSRRNRKRSTSAQIANLILTSNGQDPIEIKSLTKSKSRLAECDVNIKRDRNL